MNNLDWIVFLVVIVISIIRMLASKGGEEAAKKERERAQAGQADPDRRRQVQSEIDAFLSEVGAAPAGKPDAPQRPKQRMQERRPPRVPERRTPPRPRQPAVPNQRSARPKFESPIEKHVDEYLGHHLAHELRDEMEDVVPAEVVVEEAPASRHTPAPSRQLLRSRKPAAVSTADSIAALLQDPEGIRQAVVLNEVLQRPRIFRR